MGRLRANILLVYKNYIRYSIFNDIVNVISDDTSYGVNTIIEYNSKYFHIGEKLPTLFNVIDFIEFNNNCQFSDDEVDQLFENNSISIAK